ncbi:hypothetical protein BABINDRAFT_6431 [Babjeviella inositovora NRRL Y-12698]|uniref:Uncharacterized protein n=1 Tax=Babjeviella inositovora NRRL Y-12698 TaxID=984486 RepID=A0A1E3QVU0_9ASCO|nr:uncharacterized protein BABINDRAFT_6431 [Babjeviella inositovora NRRL Y-12698]ODQ81780.1 hypothetical protein BABINDRAFT_6431 [Babjeviella inositovora NRRL Y-12698]
MKYSAVASFATLGLATFANAASQNFDIITIKSGSDFQYSTVGVNGDTVEIVQGNGLEGAVQDDGTLKLSDGSFIVIKDGKLTTGKKGTDGFAIYQGYVTHGDDPFYVCPNAAFAIETTQCTNGTSVALKALKVGSTSAQSVPDFTPGSGSISSSSSSSSSSGSSSSGSSSSGSSSSNSTVVTQSLESTTLATITSCASGVTDCPANSASSASASISVSTLTGAANLLNGGYAAAALAAALILA